MEYRIHRYYDALPHWICCGVLFLDPEAAREHLWWGHGQPRAVAETTLTAARTRTPLEPQEAEA